MPASAYVSASELKAAISLGGQTYADADIARAVAAASRAIDNACGRYFYSTSAGTVRYYTADPYDRAVDTIDTQAVTEVAIGSGNGTFATILASGTDYDLEPYNAAETGRPYELIRLRPNRRWPRAHRNVRITGTFGWATVPDPVNQYALILASKLLKRTREAPFGVLAFGNDEPIATRITRNDPDFESMLGDYVKAIPAL